MKQFKIRASQSYTIIGEPKLKKEKELGNLSQTAKTYLKSWFKDELYNKQTTFTSKYTDKGLINEDEGIDMVAEKYGYGMLIKNETFYENDFITGTPDIITEDTVIDVKCSWDHQSFPLLNVKINPLYYAQLQCYMELTGLKKASLIYVLTDTPSHIIEREAYYYCKNNGYPEADKEIYDSFKEKMTYKDIPLNLKVKRFDFDYDPDLIGLIEKKVLKSREYIEQLKTIIKN